MQEPASLSSGSSCQLFSSVVLLQMSRSGMQMGAVGWENIKKERLFLPPLQSPLGTWPACCYVQRALVSLVRSHVATCPFGHSGLCMSHASGRQIWAQRGPCATTVVISISEWFPQFPPDFEMGFQTSLQLRPDRSSFLGAINLQAWQSE